MPIDPQLISQIPLFRHMDGSAVQAALHGLHAVEEHYSKGSFIRSAGDAADFIGIVLQGTVQILQEDYNGRRSITSAFGPGDMFAEAFSCAGAAELPVGIFAAADCTVLILKIDQLLSPQKEACGFHHLLMRNLLQLMAQKNMLLNRKLYHVSRRTTAEKLLSFLNDYARLQHANEFSIPYDRQALADYLGVDRSAMSAELSKLQKQGLLQTKGSHFKLIK